MPTKLPRRTVLLAGLAVSAAPPVRAQGADAVALAGDLVACPNDHPIAELNRPLAPDDPLPLSAFSRWRMAPPTTLSPAPPCPRCGRAWYEALGPGGTAGHPQVLVARKGWLPA